jgi:anthranilate/para-aminobenzoate synthase component II
MILMIDNYDSFTFNVVQYLGELQADVKVVRNDEITVDDIARMAPEKIVISPGPCTPNEPAGFRCWAFVSATRASARPSVERSFVHLR